MYVSASIDVGSQTMPAVPVDAIVKSDGKNYIFVLVEEGNKAEVMHFQKVEVVTGITDLGYIEIKPLEEIKQNSKIVIKGAFYILSKSQGASEEEH